MHEELWQQLIVLDGHKTSQRAKCQYLLNPERYVLTLLNTEYVVNLSDRHIFAVRDCSELSETPSNRGKSAEFLELKWQLEILLREGIEDLTYVRKVRRGRRTLVGRCTFRLTVEKVYRGTHYPDTSIAEARLLLGSATPPDRPE